MIVRKKEWEELNSKINLLEARVGGLEFPKSSMSLKTAVNLFGFLSDIFVIASFTCGSFSRGIQTSPWINSLETLHLFKFA